MKISILWKKRSDAPSPGAARFDLSRPAIYFLLSAYNTQQWHRADFCLDLHSGEEIIKDRFEAKDFEDGGMLRRFVFSDCVGRAGVWVGHLNIV